jgi:hypothetical protein
MLKSLLCGQCVDDEPPFGNVCGRAIDGWARPC